MANDLVELQEEFWGQEMQMIFQKENVAIGFANTRFEAVLKKGTRVHSPYIDKPRDAAYVKGTAITVPDYDATDDYLDIDQTRVVPFYYDLVDDAQNKYNFTAENARRAMRLLNNRIDQKVLNECYSNASDDVYNDDVGGSGATTAITITTSNIQQFFTAAGRKLSSQNIPANDRVAIISPRLMETVRLYLGGKDTNLADEVGQNGLVGRRFGFRILESNNCPYTATWTPADQCSESDTVTIQGVVFTFNATPSGAGSVDIGSGVAGCITNLVACINDTGTAGTTYIQLTAASRNILHANGIVATDGTTVMTLVGYGDLVVSDLAGTEWSVQIQHIVFAANKAVDLVTQIKPNLEERKVDNKLGSNYFAWTNFGAKLFTEQQEAVIDGNINASAWA